MTKLPTLERVKQLLRYDPETGEWHYRIACGRQPAGAKAGSVRPDGYVYLSVDGCRILSHRLAVFYMTGVWPKGQVDHKFGKEAGDSFRNLRDVPPSWNSQNKRRKQTSSKSGWLGVSVNGRGYQARIKKDGAVIIIGQFPDPEAAHEAYLKTKRKLHPGCTI